MAGIDGQSWKVGQLARLTGCGRCTTTTRWNCLLPSARTPSGHRLYGEPDVRRLYRIVALRELGLPLEVIGDLLTGEQISLIYCGTTCARRPAAGDDHCAAAPAGCDGGRGAGSRISTSRRSPRSHGRGEESGRDHAALLSLRSSSRL